MENKPDLVLIRDVNNNIWDVGKDKNDDRKGSRRDGEGRDFHSFSERVRDLPQLASIFSSIHLVCGTK